MGYAKGDNSGVTHLFWLNIFNGINSETNEVLTHTNDIFFSRVFNP